MCNSLKYINLIITPLLASIILSGCFFSYCQEPKQDGPAYVFNSEGVYYALFPRVCSSLYNSCNSDSSARITLDRESILAKEKVFRESYYKALVEPAEKLHPDSSGEIAEFPGEYMVIRQVTKQEYLNNKLAKYKNTLAWDRQYEGYVNSKKDTILIINMLDPSKVSRGGLGEGWYWGCDGAYNYYSTVAFNLSDNSITYDVCEALK